MKRQRVWIVFLLVFAWGGLMGCNNGPYNNALKDYQQNVEQAIWSKDGNQIAFLYSHLENSQTRALTKYIYTLDVEKRQLKQITRFDNQRSGGTLALLDWVADKKFLISMDTQGSQEKMYEIDMSGQRSDPFPAQIQDSTTGNNQAYYTDDLKSLILLVKNPRYGNTGKTENSVIQFYDDLTKKFSDLNIDFPPDIEKPIEIQDLKLFSTPEKTRLSITVMGNRTKEKPSDTLYQMSVDVVAGKVTESHIYKQYTVIPHDFFKVAFMGWKSVDEIVYSHQSASGKPQYTSHNLVTNQLQVLNYPFPGLLNPNQTKLMAFTGMGFTLLVSDLKNPVNQVLIDFETQLPKGDFNH